MNIRLLTILLSFCLAFTFFADADAAKKNRPAAAPQQAAEKPQPKINLVWDHIHAAGGSKLRPEKMHGLDIVSPTWFAVTGEDGSIRSYADAAYVEDAHAKGYQVWALITNSFNPELTHKILTNDAAQDHIIRQLLQHAADLRLDGINIDFENIYEADKDAYAAFVEKLAGVLRQHNLIVSVDITVPAESPNWSKCYDRRRLADAVDYVMLMTYDEHWSKSTKSGSVASLPWVEKGVKNTLEFVPKEKLLLGIPFYTREWEETTNETGTKTVKAKTMSMAAVQQTIDAYGLQPVWLPEAGQYYVEYEKNGAIYKIWMETAQSIALKAALVQKYDLAGIASWRKDFEAPQIWYVLDNALRP